MKNDKVSTERIWKNLSMRLRFFLIQRVSDEQVADDLLQETFLRIHKRLGDIDDKQRITAWVFQVARNLVVDYYRSKAREATAMADDVEDRSNEGDNLNQVVATWAVEMMSQLPFEYREAVELYELRGASQQEIADQLGISLSGAKSRVQRGRAKVKALLLDCCAFERDRRGNVIGYEKNAPDGCGDRCDC